MIIKSKNPRHSVRSICDGVHAVYISDIKAVSYKSGELLKNKNDEIGIDIVFRNEYNSKTTFRYWKSEANRWIIKELCKATGVEWTPETGRKDLMKKWLFILVAKEYLLENGKRKKDFEEEDIYRYVVLPDFRALISKEVKPVIAGDPNSNDGVGYGVFVREYDTAKDVVDLNWFNYPHQKELSTGF